MCPIASWGQCWCLAWEDGVFHGGFFIVMSMAMPVHVAKIFLGGGILWVSFGRFLCLGGFVSLKGTGNLFGSGGQFDCSAAFSG